MKRLTIVFTSIILLFSFAFIVSANSNEEAYNWFIKKRKGECPEFPKEARIVDSYGGIYTDKSENGVREKRIYLTFDAGYENGNIEKIAKVMKDEGVKGSFFILSNLVFKNAELVKKLSIDGHLICNHTSNHKDMTKLTEGEIKDNINRLTALCEERTGVKISPYFRFPEGKYSEKALKAVKELGYTSVFWSVAYADWDNGKQPSEEFALNTLISQLHPGAIILLHPTSKTNAAIIKEFIVRAKSEGYVFSTLDYFGK